MRTNVVRGFGVAAAAALLLSSTACGGAAESTGSGTKGSGTSAPGSSAGKPLTGTRLKGLLIPAAEMPKGFTEDREGTEDSGDASVTVAADRVAADKVCAALDSTSWIRVAGITPVSFAQSAFVKGGDGQIAQEIDVYKGGDATKVMAALKKVFATCKAYTDGDDAQVGPVKMKLVQLPLPTRAGTGVKAVLTTPAYDGGMTLAAIQVGDAVVTTFYNSAAKSKGAAAALMAKKIAERVKAAQG